MSKQDFYQTLGIAKNSTDAEIKKAYRRLAMKHHPDRNPGNKASEKKNLRKAKRPTKSYQTPERGQRMINLDMQA